MTDLNVYLRFIRDAKTEKEAQEAIDRVTNSFSRMSQQTQAAQKVNLKVGKEIYDIYNLTGKKLDDIISSYQKLGYGTRTHLEASVDAWAEIAQTTGQTANNLQRIEQNTTSMRRGGGMMLAGMTGFTLAMTGMQMQRLGQAGLSPIGAYTEAFGETETASAEWLATQERLESVMVRIGRVMAEEMLPVMEKLADLAEKAADFAEQHPDAVKAAGTLFGGAIVGGGALSVLGNILSGAASIGSFGMLTGMTGMAGGASLGLGGLFSTGGIAGIGAGGGYIVNKLLEKAGVNEGAGWLGILGTILSGGNPILASMAGIRGVMNGMGMLTTTTPGTQTTSLSTAPDFTEKQLEAYIDYQEKEYAAQVKYQESREKLVSNFNAKMVALEQNYQNSRAALIRNYHQTEQRAQATYYMNRKKLAADYNQDIQRMEEDHQVKMRKLAEDHDDRMESLIANRDALGIVREMRDYERSRRDEEENYRREAARRNQDYAQRVKEMAEQYAMERKFRLQQFQQNLKDLAEDYRAKRQAAREQHRQELKELQDKYNAERRQRREALIKILEDTAEGLDAERKLRQKFTKAMLADLAALIKQATGGSLPPSRDMGGYMSPGLYRNASGAMEFALSPQTTRAAERIAAGRLTQANILRMMMSGGGGRVVYNDHRRIDGRILPEDRRAMNREVDEKLIGLFA